MKPRDLARLGKETAEFRNATFDDYKGKT